ASHQVALFVRRAVVLEVIGLARGSRAWLAPLRLGRGRRLAVPAAVEPGDGGDRAHEQPDPQRPQRGGGADAEHRSDADGDSGGDEARGPQRAAGGEPEHGYSRVPQTASAAASRPPAPTISAAASMSVESTRSPSR